MNGLTLDYANCLADRVGDHGIAAGDLEAAAGTLTDLTERLGKSRGTGWERWRELPFDPVRSRHLLAVKDLVGRYQSTTDNLVVLGIGGSALGNIALQAALNPATYNLMPRERRGGPRLFVLDNVDPHLVGQTLRFVAEADPGFARTVVNVISKSGETAETAAQFIIARSMLREAVGAGYAEHIVAITDENAGTMRAICDAEGYATLPVPEGVGGRFSVLSPVGLFSAAMCGIDVDALLDGAADMDARCSAADAMKNPAAILAWLLVEFAKRGKPNHVLMPYCNALYLLADWFRQLWAESLGKRHDLDGAEVCAGATPIKALGTTDQHSQVQLYREGPNDKVIGFLEVESFDHDVTIPADLDVENLRYLQGQSLAMLLNAEKRATEYALLESKRPNFTIRFPRLDAHAVGQFIQLWQVTTAYAGLLLNIDAYDQPAVETGKKATFGLMGRAGYEEWKTRVDAALMDTEHRA
jgi:glucose-6-phosphate isomerase